MADLQRSGRAEATSPSPEPAPFGPDAAAHLRLTKRDVLRPVAGGDTEAIQFGAAYLDGVVSLPGHDASRTVTEPLIDMFVCTDDGTCTPTGMDGSLIELWTPSVSALAETFFAAMADQSVPVAPTAYVTASLTPPEELIGEGHFDDDQYLPDGGIGVVVILGSDAGPRVATEQIPVGPARAGLPLTPDQSIFDHFTQGKIPHHQAAPDRPVVFPQFAQLHSGPPLAAAGHEEYRRLLVLRAETEPI